MTPSMRPEPGQERPLERRDPAPRAGGRKAVAGLVLFAAAAALIVGAAVQLTRGRIQDNEARALRAALEAVLPAGLDHDNPLHEDVLLPEGQPGPIYRARREGKPVAAVLTAVAPNGYGGPIRLLVAVDPSGRILGVRATAHSETPGIGDAIDTDKSDWILSLTGHSLAENPPPWTVRREGGDFDAISGATVTSRAVLSATQQALQYFTDHLQEIFSEPADGAKNPRQESAVRKTTGRESTAAGPTREAVR